MTDSLNGAGGRPAVREGMRVVDATGKDVGRVEFVKLGDPDAVTPQGQATDALEPRVAGELAERLLRVGFVKVDRKGFFNDDAYVAMDEIDRVEGDTVHLLVKDDALLRED
jgi:hypothetical protein